MHTLVYTRAPMSIGIMGGLAECPRNTCQVTSHACLHACLLASSLGCLSAHLRLAHQEGVVDALHVCDKCPVLQSMVLVLVVHNQAGQSLLHCCWGCHQGLDLVLHSCARQGSDREDVSS